MNIPQAFIFFGIVGSGKGTQIELLQKYLLDNNLADNIVFMSPGLGYRKLVGEGYYTGDLVNETMKKGYLQPDFLTNGLVVNNLAFDMKQNSTIFADGFPRTLVQSKALEDILEYYNRKNVSIIYIEVGKDEAIKRMKIRARSDDTDEAIAKRFDEYVNNVIPSMYYFKNKNGYTIYSINGEQSIQDVHKELINKIGL